MFDLLSDIGSYWMMILGGCVWCALSWFLLTHPQFAEGPKLPRWKQPVGNWRAVLRWFIVLGVSFIVLGLGAGIGGARMRQKLRNEVSEINAEGAVVTVNGATLSEPSFLIDALIAISDVKHHHTSPRNEYRVVLQSKGRKLELLFKQDPTQFTNEFFVVPWKKRDKSPIGTVSCPRLASLMKGQVNPIPP